MGDISSFLGFYLLFASLVNSNKASFNTWMDKRYFNNVCCHLADTLFLNETNEPQNNNSNSIIHFKGASFSDFFAKEYVWPFPILTCARLNPVSRQNISKVASEYGANSSGITPGNLNKLFCKLSLYEGKETTVTGRPFLPNG